MPYFIRQYTGLPYPDPNDTAAANAFVISAQDQSLTTSILSAGTFFGAIIAGDVADYIGRRVTIMLGCLIFTIGCIFEVASTGLAVMVSRQSHVCLQCGKLCWSCTDSTRSKFNSC